MRILELHCDYVKYTARTKAFKGAEELSEWEKQEKKVENVLAVLTSVEQGDDAATIVNAAREIEKNFREVKAESILVYPYAHLSSNLAAPQTALDLLKQLTEECKKFCPSVSRSPFGWYKLFELRCKGHPLSELSKSVSVQAQQAKTISSGDAMKEFAVVQKEKLLLAKEGKENDKVQRTGAVVLAAAAFETIGAKLVDVSLTQEGFYCDFESKPITPKDAEAISEAARAIISSKEKISAKKVDAKESEKLLKDNRFALAVAKEIGSAKVLQTKQLNAVYFGSTLENSCKIYSVAIAKFGGSHLNNKEGNPALQRIYAIAFASEESETKYKKLLEESEKRDHRKIGSQLDLFSLHEESPGSVFYHPNGMALRNQLEKYWRQEHEQEGYAEIRTPIILSDELWRRSGHYDHYRENMYFTSIDGKQNAVKPMNCPGAILVFKNSSRSYRELPLRLCELGLVHRHELSGVLNGLFRVRSFTQDDAHIFVTPEQINGEVKKIISLFERIYKKFGFSFEVELSTKPEKAMGAPELWEQAENSLKKALKESKLAFGINEGDGAFYGPKIDFKLTDAIGRKWQCGTIQLDFQMPERFEILYTDADGKQKRPVIIHRVVYGSLERFLGVLIEHYAGDFPLWLSPVQAIVIPMSSEHEKYAQKVFEKLKENGCRAELDNSRGTMEAKIRDAQMQKIPFTIVVGSEEEKSNTIAVRERKSKDIEKMKLEKLLEKIES